MSREVDEPDPGDYPDWTHETSFVISGPVGPGPKFRGERVPTAAVARLTLLRRHGRLFSFETRGGRWAARIPRPKPWQSPWPPR